MVAKVPLVEVVNALEMASDELSSFVNKQTGQVITVPNESLRMAQDGPDQDLLDWQQTELEEAQEVLGSKDWLELPSKFEVHEWEIMNRFAKSLSVLAQRNEILDSIHGSGAFRNFKGAIRRLRLEEAWFAFKASALEDIARSWLEDHELEPVG
jgi:hypothetical protein